MSLPLPSENDDPRYTRRGAMYVPSGEGVHRWVSDDVYTIKATAKNTNGSLGLVEASIPPGGGPPAHAHMNADEAFYMLSGELEFLDGDRTFIAGPGDFVFVPRGTRHRFKNIGIHPGRMLFLSTPGGLEEPFIQAGDEPQPGVQAPQWGLEKFGPLAAIVNELGLETDILPEMP